MTTGVPPQHRWVKEYFRIRYHLDQFRRVPGLLAPLGIALLLFA